MKKLSNKGFTLVELIIVIAILAIIMLIAIPNFSGIQQRMKVRADKTTAAQIGKAIRVWYTDYTTDPVLNATLDAGTGKTFLAGNTMVDYTTLAKYDSYCSKFVPTSMLDASGVPYPDQQYVVGLVGDSTSALICVGIQGKATAGTYGTLPVSTTVAYDGTKDAVAYVEPGVVPSPAAT